MIDSDCGVLPPVKTSWLGLTAIGEGKTTGSGDPVGLGEGVGAAGVGDAVTTGVGDGVAGTGVGVAGTGVGVAGTGVGESEGEGEGVGVGDAWAVMLVSCVGLLLLPP